ncbi:MAG: ABC transporter permease, partial [Eggerthellales bacterium]|nr:ABC transporter permease [Eggerthellales bacterium]
MLSLAWRNVIRRLGQSSVTALIVAIVVFVVTVSFATVSSVKHGLELSQDRLGADVMVLPAGASSNAPEVLFTAQPVNVYLDQSVTETVAHMEGVAQCTPQFFTQTVDASCCSVVGVTRVVGVDMESDFVIGPWLTVDLAEGLGEDGIILGSNAPDIEGGQASILGSVFYQRGTLSQTGTSVDETIFMDIDVARAIAYQSPYLTSIWESTDPFTSVSCVMVKVEEGADPASVADSIVSTCPGVIAVTTSDMISGVSSQLSVVAEICLVLLVLLVVVAALALGGRFSSMANARMSELGLLRSMGVSRGGCAWYLILETGILVIIGSAAGVILGCLAGSMALDLVRDAFAIPGSVSL